MVETCRAFGLVADYGNGLVLSYALRDADAARIDVLETDGHDHAAIAAALKEADEMDKPVLIIAHTVKGKGVSFMENQVGWHGKAPSRSELDQAIQELEA